MELTQELIIKHFLYDKGVLYWKQIPINSNRKIGQIAGFIRISPKEKRHVIGIGQKQYLRSRLVFLFHHGYLPEIVDHANRNTIDDRIENLRAADKSNNNKNKKSKEGSTSKYLGVSLKRGRWCSRISTTEKTYQLGIFLNEIEAALEYNKAAVKLHKEFANLNIITP